MTGQIIVTLFMMLAIIILLLKGVSSPGTIFIFVPITAAFLMGYSPAEINGFIGSGLQSVSGTVFLMVFAVLYFGILHEAGVFNAVVRAVMRKMGNSVYGTLAIASVLSMITQLDGSGATTALCTIPAMRPIFERQKIRKEALMLVFGLGSGVLCILPWAPALVEACAYVGVDVHTVFRFLLPLLIFSIILVFVFCIPVAMLERKHGAGFSQEEYKKVKKELLEKTELPFGKGKAIFDGVFTLILMCIVLLGLLPTNVAFGLGYTILLLINYRKPEEQRNYMKKQAPTALNLAYTMLGIGVLVGINNGTEALFVLAKWAAANVPQNMLVHLPIILCILSMPLAITLGNARISVVLPALIPIVVPLGFSTVQVLGSVFAVGVIAASVCMFNPSPYLALGLAGVDMKEHIKYSLLPTYAFSLIMTAFVAVTGMLPV